MLAATAACSLGIRPVHGLRTLCVHCGAQYTNEYHRRSRLQSLGDPSQPHVFQTRHDHAVYLKLATLCTTFTSAVRPGPWQRPQVSVPLDTSAPDAVFVAAKSPPFCFICAAEVASVWQLEHTAVFGESTTSSVNTV